MPSLTAQHVRRITSLSRSGPPLIVAGLVALMAVGIFPKIPAVTALSILMLGATNATLDRYHRSPAITMFLLLHTTIYVMLYALFVGATLHAAASTPSGITGPLAALDLAASLVPMGYSLKRIAAALRQQFEHQR